MIPCHPHLTCVIEDNIARVSLNRPHKLNGLTLEILYALTKTAKAIKKHKNVRAVLLMGEGKSFSAGLDFDSALKSRARLAQAFFPLLLRGTNAFQEACWSWRRLPIPVIAVIHGHCYGGGLQLALAADFRFSTPTAEFSIMETKWGLIPDMTGALTLSELIGIDVAKRLTMTAELFDGNYAKEIGLVTDVGEDPLNQADLLIQQIIQRPPEAIAAAKSLLNRSWKRLPRACFARERRAQLQLLLHSNPAQRNIIITDE